MNPADTNDSQISQTENNSAVAEMTSIEGMIRRNFAQIERLREQMKAQKEMVDSVLDNDPTYKEHEAAAKEATRVKTTTKQQLLRQPQNSHIVEKIKDIQAEKKEAQDALSNYLADYQKSTGLNEFEGEDGEVRQIVFVAKLVKRSMLQK